MSRNFAVLRRQDPCEILPRMSQQMCRTTDYFEIKFEKEQVTGCIYENY
jgi:hypothetical protein